MQRYKEIMGLKERDYWQVIQNVKDTMEIVRRDNLNCNVNLQMVTITWPEKTPGVAGAN